MVPRLTQSRYGRSAQNCIYSSRTMHSPPQVPRRDYRDPRTGLGVVLSDVGGMATTDFNLHQVGCLHFRDWNHRGMLSPYWRLHHNVGPGNYIDSKGDRFNLDEDGVVVTPAGVQIDTYGPKTPLHTWIHF